jgi:hypothetical protein
MGDKNDLILGVKAMAERADKTERTIHRWLERREAACFGLVPLSHFGGGGAAAVRGGEVGSFDALIDLIRATTSNARAEAGRQRGQGSVDQYADPLVIQCSTATL